MRSKQLIDNWKATVPNFVPRNVFFYFEQDHLHQVAAEGTREPARGLNTPYQVED